MKRINARGPASTVRSGQTSRMLDRHLGRIALRTLRLVRRSRPLVGCPQHIGLCAFGALGDALLASALAHDLHRVLPGCRITLVATATNKAIAPLLPSVDALLVVPVTRPDHAIRLIRSANFDLVIDCNQWIRVSALHAAMAGCCAIGFRTAGQGRHHAFDHVVDHLATRHELENYRALLAPLGVEPQARPAVSVPLEAYAVATRLLHDARGDASSEGMVVFHPWAGGRHAWLKEWPMRSWILLAAALQKRGLNICVTGGPADVANTHRLVEAAGACNVAMRSVAGDLQLTEVAALLSRAQAVVAVNTGIMHLAAAVTGRLVALHGPTNPARWGPLNEHAAVIVPKGVPSGYLHLGFEFPKRAVDCMAAIPVAAVLDAVLHRIGSSERAPAALSV